jgi:hypothetical protein
MARRVVQECDLTKQEYDPAETVTLVIKRSGKKQGRTYELSAAAAAILEQQLVAGNKLPEGWGFESRQESRQNVAIEGSGKRTLADLDTDDDRGEDSQFVAAKKREMQEEGVDTEPREKDDDQATILPEIAVDDSGCMHINKGPIQTTMHQGKRKIYRTCRDCRKRINEKTKDERASFLGAKAPPDTREGHSPEAKERNRS